MSKLVWHTEANGLLCTELDCLRLTVGLIDRPANHARFLVFRQSTGEGAGGLIGSGTEGSLREAIEAAEHIAEECVDAGRCAIVRFPDRGGLSEHSEAGAALCTAKIESSPNGLE